MRVLLLAPYFPPETGGVPTLYHNICRTMPTSSIFVVAPRYDGDDNFDKNQSYKIYRIKGFSEMDIQSIPALIKEFLFICRIIKKESITHIWVGHVNQSLTGLMLMILTSKKIFLYAHGEEIAQDYGGRIYHLFKGLFLKRVWKAIAVSHFTKSELIKREVPHSAIKVINNAVDCKELFPTEKDPQLVGRWGLKDKKVIMTISRLEKRKGQDQMIRALPFILNVVSNAHYMICGTGEEQDHLIRLVNEFGLQDYVSFAGHIPQELLCAVYNLADLFVMPNRKLDNDVNEGFGIVFLEAGACGIPVIGGKAGGVPDAILDGKTGFLVDGTNINEIVDTSCKILTNASLARDMGNAGRAHSNSQTYSTLVTQLRETIL